MLKKYGVLLEDEQKYSLYLQITEELFQETWNEMLKLWNGRLCNELANEYLSKNIEALSELFSGKINATHILFPEGKFDYANALYKETYIFKYFNALIFNRISEMGELLKNIRILELGAGTGATTDFLVPLIEKHINMTYYFTDISQVFLCEAMKRYSFLSNITYQKLDINSLDFNEKVDIVIANGVLNNAKNIKNTISKILGLLRPNGKIFMIEQVEESLEMLVSQAFMMENTEEIGINGGKTFKNTKEWIQMLQSERIKNIEVFPDNYIIEQKMFVIDCK